MGDKRESWVVLTKSNQGGGSPEKRQVTSDFTKNTGSDQVDWKQLILEASRRQGYTGIPL